MAYSGDDVTKPSWHASVRVGGFDDEWLKWEGVDRAHILHEIVNINDAPYEVPVVDKNYVDWWPKGWRLGLVRPSYLWTLIAMNAHKGLTVRAVDDDLTVVTRATDPLLVWDAVASFAATVDETLVIYSKGPRPVKIRLTPDRDVMATCYELDSVSGADGDPLDGDGEWPEGVECARLAWDLAWKRHEL